MDRGEFQQDSVLKQLEVLKEEEKEFQNLKVSRTLGTGLSPEPPCGTRPRRQHPKGQGRGSSSLGPFCCFPRGPRRWEVLAAPGRVLLVPAARWQMGARGAPTLSLPRSAGGRGAGAHQEGGHHQPTPHPVPPSARTPPTATTASTPSRSTTRRPPSRCRAARPTCAPPASSGCPRACPSPTSTAR